VSLPATAHPWHDPGPRGTASNLDNIDSSYQFHRELESPVAFMRREWRALVIFGGGFVAVLLVGVLAVDPAYFYPRLATDPLRYYLKGLAFAGTGHVIARSAVNSEPFHYVSMPGMLRSPFIAAFRNFGDQLRAIQVANIALVTATAAMFSYVLSWAVPRARHWMAIGYAFGFILLSSAWVANVFAPLADALYEAFTIAALIIVTRVICSDRPIRSRPFAIAGAAILFAPCAPHRVRGRGLGGAGGAELGDDHATLHVRTDRIPALRTQEGNVPESGAAGAAVADSPRLSVCVSARSDGRCLPSGLRRIAGRRRAHGGRYRRIASLLLRHVAGATSISAGDLVLSCGVAGADADDSEYFASLHGLPANGVDLLLRRRGSAQSSTHLAAQAAPAGANHDTLARFVVEATGESVFPGARDGAMSWIRRRGGWEAGTGILLAGARLACNSDDPGSCHSGI
jgi:hypothetical protein